MAIPLVASSERLNFVVRGAALISAALPISESLHGKARERCVCVAMKDERMFSVRDGIMVAGGRVLYS